MTEPPTGTSPAKPAPTGSGNPELVLTVILLLLVVTALRLASSLLIPIAISLLLTFLLSPVVRWLHAKGMRESIAAAIVVFGTVGVLGAGVAGLADPASEWLGRSGR